mmetsp:Transcript_96433/g.251353  ORF Transcript_96433/g.251353 Transcript_96433/m.251353 type:complete len:201 (-) Transcript_96433:846-1448(-)
MHLRNVSQRLGPPQRRQPLLTTEHIRFVHGPSAEVLGVVHAAHEAAVAARAPLRPVVLHGVQGRARDRVLDAHLLEVVQVELPAAREALGQPAVPPPGLRGGRCRGARELASTAGRRVGRRRRARAHVHHRGVGPLASGEHRLAEGPWVPGAAGVQLGQVRAAGRLGRASACALGSPRGRAGSGGELPQRPLALHLGRSF